MDRRANDIIFLVQEDKRLYGEADPFAQLIAEAIAASQHNNRLRAETGQPLLQSKVCISVL